MAKARVETPDPCGFMPRQIVRNRKFDYIDRCVYAVLYAMQGLKDEIEIDFSTLARIFDGGDREALGRSVKKLVSIGWLTQYRAPSRNLPGLYRVDLVSKRNQKQMFAEMRERQAKEQKIRRIRPLKTA